MAFLYGIMILAMCIYQLVYPEADCFKWVLLFGLLGEVDLVTAAAAGWFNGKRKLMDRELGEGKIINEGNGVYDLRNYRK